MTTKLIPTLLLSLTILASGACATTSSGSGDDDGTEEATRDTRAPDGKAIVETSCSFAGGWVSLVPRELYDVKKEYLMQALIGFTQDPEFWSKQPEYVDLASFAAQRCGPDGATRFEVTPGEWWLVVGWEGRFEAHGDYVNNGAIEKLHLEEGQVVTRSWVPDQLTHGWSCISCPYLLIRGDGGWQEVGQVLVDRYSPRMAGTDARTLRATVRDGVLRLRIDEREPETTHLDAVEVSAAGRALPLLAGAPEAVRAADGVTAPLHMGERLELRFDASGLPDGPVDVEVRVTGHYVPLVDL